MQTVNSEEVTHMKLEGGREAGVENRGEATFVTVGTATRLRSPPSAPPPAEASDTEESPGERDLEKP